MGEAGSSRTHSKLFSPRSAGASRLQAAMPVRQTHTHTQNILHGGGSFAGESNYRGDRVAWCEAITADHRSPKMTSWWRSKCHLNFFFHFYFKKNCFNCQKWDIILVSTQDVTGWMHHHFLETSSTPIMGAVEV